MKRFDELDSMRGVAAFAVLMAHAIAVSTAIPGYLNNSPLYFLWAAHEAVIFFFVLSGFVLTLPFINKGKLVYSSFIVKRFTRIYIPYFIAIMCAVISRIFLDGSNFSGLGEWINIQWQEPLTLSSIFSHLLLIGNYNTRDLNPVIWSLIQEMRISLIFPVIILLIKRYNWIISISLGLVLSIVSGLNDIFRFEESLGYNNTFFDTLHYTSMFIIGALLAKHLNYLINLYQVFSSKFKWFPLLVFGSSFFLYTYSRFLGILPTAFDKKIVEWGISLGAVGFILIALGTKNVSDILKNKYIHLNGKVSFSLYLYHTTILFVLFNLLNGKTSSFVIYSISALMIFVISYLSWKYIEMNSVRLGKILTNKKKPKPVENFQKSSSF
jgi:peptidoglycan/LPS O-acetylase OafA/YrhL